MKKIPTSPKPKGQPLDPKKIEERTHELTKVFVEEMKSLLLAKTDEVVKTGTPEESIAIGFAFLQAAEYHRNATLVALQRAGLLDQASIDKANEVSTSMIKEFKNQLDTTNGPKALPTRPTGSNSSMYR